MTIRSAGIGGWRIRLEQDIRRHRRLIAEVVELADTLS